MVDLNGLLGLGEVREYVLPSWYVGFYVVLDHDSLCFRASSLSLPSFP